MKKFTKLLFIGLFACLMLLTVVFAVGCKPDDPEKNLTFKDPKSGRGTASYLSEIIPGDQRNMKLDTSAADFSPYEVEQGTYKVKFTSADQKIYYSFTAPKIAVFKVYSTTLQDAVDPTITLFYGSLMTGYRNPKLIGESSDEKDYYSDNKSDTDKNFYLEFTCDDSYIQQDGGRFLFELNLADPAGVDKEFAITFAYEKEYVPPQQIETTVKQATQIKDFEIPQGTWVDAPLNTLDEEFEPILGADGYYHRNDANGEIIFAILGYTDEENSDNNIAPRGLDRGFKGIYQTDGGAFIESGATYIYDWSQLMLAYDAHSKEARHPVTPELKDFLSAYIGKTGTKVYIEEALGERLPTGKEWIWACGYYQGTEDHRQIISQGSNDISIELGENGEIIPIWVEFDTHAEGKYFITSTSTNLKMEWYGESVDAVPTEIKSTEEGFSYSFNGRARSIYIMKFSTVDGAAEETTLTVVYDENTDPNGSWDYPYVLNNDSIVDTHSENITERDLTIYYTFTPDADINLKITFGAGTTLSIDYQEGDASIQISSDNGEQFVNGALTMVFREGTTYRFAMSISTASGTASFTAERVR